MAFTMKQGDTLPDFTRSLLVGGVAADLEGAEAFFLLGRKGFESAEINEKMTILDAPGGVVRHVWADGSTLNLEGDYIIEIEVRYADGKVLTFPNDRDGEPVTFLKDIGDGGAL